MPILTRLILWDIDHTLVDSAGLGRQMYERAFRAVTGRQLVHWANMTGRTDQAIMSETLKLHGIEPAARLDDCFTALNLAAAELRDEVQAQGKVLPGAREALAALAAAGATQSVVTGNLAGVASIKLQALGLDHLLDLEVGGYGSDGDTRPPLIRAAIERASRKYGRSFQVEDVVVIGDTPLDVAGAHEVGVSAIAVASGSSSVGALQATGAQAVLAELTDIDTLLSVALNR